MNTHATDTFQKYERKRPSKHSSDNHSERHNKHSCVKQAWRSVRESKRNWSGEE